jgi:integrase
LESASASSTSARTSHHSIVTKHKLSTISNDDSLLSRYLTSVAISNESTAQKYGERLKKFGIFGLDQYGMGIENIVPKMRIGKMDPYDVLSRYTLYLKQKTNNNISPNSLKNHITTIKNFLEYSDIDISPRKFKLKIRLPRIVTKNKEALSKEDVVDILNACSDIRLKTYVMFLAAGGFRAVEALSIRVKDLDLESKPARVFVRGEYTKTRADRAIFLTDEITQQLKSWLSYKYRKRRICHNKDGKTITEYRTPSREETDLVFGVYQTKRMPNPDGIYDDIAKSFAKTLDRMGRGEREDSNQNRRQITLHSFRRFVKTTISDLGYFDFSEYFIGHSGSTYWRKI